MSRYTVGGPQPFSLKLAYKSQELEHILQVYHLRRLVAPGTLPLIPFIPLRAIRLGRFSGFSAQPVSVVSS